MSRPGWDSYFLEIARVVSTRSTCLRRRVGAVAVKNRQILATGYNGAPTGLPHCEETGCRREELGVPSGERQELCRGLHAEQNCIIQAALNGVRLKGCIFYTTHQPCVICAKMIVNAGAEKVVTSGEYPDSLSLEILSEAGIELLRIDCPVPEKGTRG